MEQYLISTRGSVFYEIYEMRDRKVSNLHLEQAVRELYASSLQRFDELSSRLEKETSQLDHLNEIDASCALKFLGAQYKIVDKVVHSHYSIFESGELPKNEVVEYLVAMLPFVERAMRYLKMMDLVRQKSNTQTESDYTQSLFYLEYVHNVARIARDYPRTAVQLIPLNLKLKEAVQAGEYGSAAGFKEQIWSIERNFNIWPFPYPRGSL